MDILAVFYASVFTIGIPLCGALFIFLMPKENQTTIKKLFLLTCFATLIFVSSLGYFLNFEDHASRLVLDWMPSLGSAFVLKMDVMSFLFCLLTAFVYSAFSIYFLGTNMRRAKEFLCFLLLAKVGLLGLFLSGDAILFYLFWEGGLIPTYFMLLIWSENSRSSSIAAKYIGYTVFGSLLLLIAMIFMANEYRLQFGEISFIFDDWKRLRFPEETATYLFWAFAVAFLVKTPIFPFHTWQPETYRELPTPAAALTASLFSKVGLYGILRLSTEFFPDSFQQFSLHLSALAALSIVYGGLMAFSQNNLKGVLAYSSISHLGFVVLGLFSVSESGFQGAFFTIFSHALITAGLFFALGALEEKYGHLNAKDFGGLIGKAPVFTAMFIFLAMASIGLPGLSGFVGEFLVLKGAFSAFPIIASISTLGVVLSACYFLKPIQLVFFGIPSEKIERTSGVLSFSKGLAIVPLIIGILVLGIYPMVLIDLFQSPIQNLAPELFIKK